MKKSVFCLGLCCTLILTGCGGKTLTCTKSEDELGMKMSNEVKLTFDSKGTAVKKGVYDIGVEVPEELAELADMDSLLKSYEDEFKNFEDMGVKVNSSSKGNKINIKISYDVDKLNEDQKDELSDEDLYSDKTYDEVKKSFEDDGYTCK